MSQSSPRQLQYARAMRWVALDIEQRLRTPNVAVHEKIEPGFEDAIKQVITNLRRQASRIESRQ